MEKWIKIEVIPYQKIMKKRSGWPNSIQNVLLRLVILIIIQYYQASPHDSLTQTGWTGQDFRPGCLTWPVQPVQLVRHSQPYLRIDAPHSLPQKLSSLPLFFRGQRTSLKVAADFFLSPRSQRWRRRRWRRNRRRRWTILPSPSSSQSVSLSDSVPQNPADRPTKCRDHRPPRDRPSELERERESETWWEKTDVTGVHKFGDDFSFPSPVSPGLIWE